MIKFLRNPAMSLVLFSLLAANAGMAAAQDPGDALNECRTLESTLERFACYEQIEVPADSSREDTAGNERREAAVQSVDAPAESENGLFRRIWPFGNNEDGEQPEQEAMPEQSRQDVATTSALENFGRNQDNATLVENEAGEQELHDTITALEQIHHNRWRITLESGQVWRQMISQRYRLRVGDEVRIYPTLLGSNYRLTVERLSSFIQVERVN